MPLHDGSRTADVIVVGLGALGSAALFQLARRGARVIGIDRFAPPHERGSSHGETRITRQAIGEGDEYVALVLRSHEIWRELEGETGASLFSPIGGLLLGREASGVMHHGQTNFVGRSIDVARRFGIEHTVLQPAEIERRFPQFRLAGDEVGYYEPGAGFVRPERCIATQLERARAHGAVERSNETVVRITSSATGVQVVTDRAAYAAAWVVVSAGAWLSTLLGGPFPRLLRVYRQVLHWFAPDDAAAFAPGRFPIFIWIHGADGGYFYGFPALAGGVKLATEQFTETADPDRLHPPTAAESAALWQGHVRERLAGLTGRCLRSAACCYTVTPDSRFVIDRHPDWERVVVVSACSGHGFKHSAGLGEAIAERVLTGASHIDLAPFSLARFRPTP